MSFSFYIYAFGIHFYPKQNGFKIYSFDITGNQNYYLGIASAV